MPKASELLKQGRDEDLWQMCCGFLDLDTKQFMDIQERLLLKQLELLNQSKIGQKIMRGKTLKTIDEFRRFVPLTNYKDYCPELPDKMIDILPGKPELWARSSGRSGDYACKWLPLTKEYIEQLSFILYGIGIISSAQNRGDVSKIPLNPKMLYCVAPKPYISGTFADVLRMQTPSEYLPKLEKAEQMTFEERISTGFQQALDKGLDYFFGLSLVLVNVGEKLSSNSKNIKIGPYIKRPKALFRLAKGLIKSKMAGRPLMPKDIWDVKGIIGSGIDSWVYKDKIKELWGRSPLDLYSCTEGGIIATQTWDYEAMTFIPNLNFLEFITEEDQVKLAMDRTYIPKTLLIDEVKANETYEIVLTSFHGGSLIRYRVGDIVKITSLSNDKLGIKTPQMTFERRTDGIIDFNVVRLTEKMIWEALEGSGISYTDWIAYKLPGVQVLDLYIEPKGEYTYQTEKFEKYVYNKVVEIYNIDENNDLDTQKDLMNMTGFSVKIHYLEKGFFANYSLQRQKEGADMAHIKPPHINPKSGFITDLLNRSEEEMLIITKSTNNNLNSDKTGATKITV